MIYTGAMGKILLDYIGYDADNKGKFRWIL